MSHRSLCIAVAVAFGSLTNPGVAPAENRLALVIGNSAYQSVPALPNPANDAKAMAELLSSAGFDVVSAPDLTQSNMRLTIGEFADRVAGKGQDTVALVFYAGHGLQVDGDNYLVPVDARILREADVPLQTVRLADLMNALAAVPSKARIVMLDACRNNPFSEINKVTGRGLAIVDAPPGSFVSYSTSPGTEALDGEGINSPYTAALLSIAKEPGLPIEQALKRVRYAVNDATKLQQTPWESSSLTSDFSFFPGEGGGSTRTSPAGKGQQGASARATTRSVDAWKKELQRKPAREAYELVIKDDTVEAYQAYLDLFSKQLNGPRVREIFDRRRVMVAWYTAVTVNTPASFQTFLAGFPNTDLGVTAERLLDRARSRSLGADAFAKLANTCPCSLPTQTPQKRATKRATRDDDDPPPRRVTNPSGGATASPVGPPIGIGIGIGIPIGGGGGGISRQPSGPSRGSSQGHRN